MFGFLNGKKTYIAGIGLMLAAVGAVLLAWGNGVDADLGAAFQQFMAGLALIGVGHKLDKAAV